MRAAPSKFTRASRHVWRHTAHCNLGLSTESLLIGLNQVGSESSALRYNASTEIRDAKSFASCALRSSGGLKKKTVAVAVSGGVDSAVAAYLLKEQGHDVFGIFMRNWDEAEEVGNQNCSVEADLQDAQGVCSQIGIPLYQVNFVNEYWNQVFIPFLEQVSRGLTPNPDLQCNRHIKFQALLAHAQSLGAECIATGHYARLRHAKDDSVELLRALDKDKDQTYFLASVQGEAFNNVIFPLGNLLKQEVRDIAWATGLRVAMRRSSTGICFIGRRNFGQFLEEYLPAVPGTFVDIETNIEIGACSNILTTTLGQRAGLGGQKEKLFAVGKDIPRRRVYLAAGTHHPALFASSALLGKPHWMSGTAPDTLEAKGRLECSYTARYRQPMQECSISLSIGTNALNPSQFVSLHPEDRPKSDELTLLAQMPLVARSLTPQQSFVLYKDDVCLGSAPIIYPGKTLWEERLAEEPSQRVNPAAIQG